MPGSVAPDAALSLADEADMPENPVAMLQQCLLMDLTHPEMIRECQGPKYWPSLHLEIG